MDWPPQQLIFMVFLIVAAAVDKAYGSVMVTGTVFCDQCKDGHISIYDYPLHGIKVSMACPGRDGKFTMWREETTNWMGNYEMRFDGTPDLSGCYAQISGNEQGSGACAAAAGPARDLRFMFRMFNMEIYSVDPLLSQPENPMSYCRSSSTPVPAPVLPVPQLPPPIRLPPSSPPPTMPPSSPRFPFLPPLPSMPTIPTWEASACPYRNWTMPEYKCYWKLVNPDSKVAVVFGLLAARRYGRDLTLWEGMHGKGEPYKTLLREGTTALLNSCHSLQFPFHPMDVVRHLNWALMGSTRQVLHIALQFQKANSGNGRVTCRFKPCR